MGEFHGVAFYPKVYQTLQDAKMAVQQLEEYDTRVSKLHPWEEVGK